MSKDDTGWMVAGAAVVVLLYILLIAFLFVYVAPILIAFLIPMTIAFVPFIYGREIGRTYGTEEGNRVLLIAAIAVCALLCIDAAFLVQAIYSGLVLHEVPSEIREIVAIPLHALSVAVQIGTLATAGSIWDSPGRLFAAMLIKGMLVIPLAIGGRGMRGRTRKGEEPALVHYLHRDAFVDLKDTLWRTATWLFDALVRYVRFVIRYSIGIHAIFLWPVTVTLLVGVAPPVIATAILLLLVAALSSLGFLAAWAINALISLMLITTERAILKLRSGYVKCPYAGCHATIPLPWFRCPACGVIHKHLVPGRYGVLVRFCTCGQRLPTLFITGKGSLLCQCPHCERPLQEELFLGNVHIPIYGGPSAGKTMFMTAATWEVVEGHLTDVNAGFIDKGEEREYREGWKCAFEAGIARLKTTDMFPSASLLAMRREGGLPVSLYMYDPAGEALLDSSYVGSHAFLQYVTGLVIIIDPLSLPEFCRRYTDSGYPAIASASAVDPVEVLQRIINTLQDRHMMPMDGQYSDRVAIVFAKADLPLFQKEAGIRLEGSDSDRSGEWGMPLRDDSEALRTWLGHTEPGLLNLIERRFANHRFFAVSAFGHMPDDLRPSEPVGILDPLRWILSSNAALERPLYARFRQRAAEYAVAASIVCGFFALPSGILYALLG